MVTWITLQASAELAKAIAKLRVIELTKKDVTPA